MGMAIIIPLVKCSEKGETMNDAWIPHSYKNPMLKAH